MAVLGWEALTASEQDIVRRTSIAIDRHIAESGTAPTPLRVKSGTEWSPQMRALLSTWLSTDGWKVRFADSAHGSFEIHLDRSA
jgi:hypothetical protein